MTALGARVAGLAFATAAILIVACTSLLGVTDIVPSPDNGALRADTGAPDAPPESQSDAAGDASVATPSKEIDGGASEAGGCSGNACCPAGSILCNGGCLNVQADNENCGGCGLVCSGGCDAGECAVAIAFGSNITSIVVNASGIYWADNGDKIVMTAPLDGGAPVTLASGNSPNEIAVNASNVYWTDNGANAVMRIPLGGGAPTTLATGQIGPVGIAIDATHVYWANINGGTVMSMPLDGGTLTTIAGQQSSPAKVAVDTTGVYWTDDANPGTVNELDLSSWNYVTVASEQYQPEALAVDVTGVYWTDIYGGTVMALPAGGANAMPVLLAGQLSSPSAIAVDGANVYFSTQNSIMKVPIDGGPPSKLASVGANAMAVYGDSVYVGTNSNTETILKLTPK